MERPVLISVFGTRAQKMRRMIFDPKTKRGMLNGKKEEAKLHELVFTFKAIQSESLIIEHVTRHGKHVDLGC